MLNIAYRKINIKTLDKGVNNDYWEILASKGSLRIGKEKSWHGSIVAAFLAEFLSRGNICLPVHR